MKRRIYLDYASLTPIDPRVTRSMVAGGISAFANSSSLYKEGVVARNVMDEARRAVAEHIHAHADEIIFTSGGTEANNLALDGIIRSVRTTGIAKPHVIISSIEHSSIMETARALEDQGCEVTRISVDDRGIVNMDELKKSFRDSTVLVSVMMVNNEVGSIQPIREIAHLIRKVRAQRSTPVYFHTDAAQAPITQEVFVERLGVDLLTLDGSKIYGPRGIGCLYVRRGIPLISIMHGGNQENGLRPGTENIPGIVGFARAMDLVSKSPSEERTRLTELRDICISGLKEICPGIVVNGALADHQSPHILNISIPGIDNEFFLFQLDARGIACSTKSSCLRDEEESYVLKAMKVDSGRAIRLSFGRWTKKSQIKDLMKAVKDIQG